MAAAEDARSSPVLCLTRENGSPPREGRVQSGPKERQFVVVRILIQAPWFGFPFRASCSAPGSVPHSTLGPRLVSPFSAPGLVPHSALVQGFPVPLQVLFSLLGPPVRFPILGSTLGSWFGSQLGPGFSFPLGLWFSPHSAPVRFPAWPQFGPQLPPCSAVLHLPRLRFGVCLQDRGRFLRPS